MLCQHDGVGVGGWGWDGGWGLTGTQNLYGSWKLLKKPVGPQIGTCDLKDRLVCHELLDMFKSFMHHTNSGCHLWNNFGKLAKKRV